MSSFQRGTGTTFQGVRGSEWCPGAGSNHRHRDFQSRALPTELPGRASSRAMPSRRTAQLIVALAAVHLFRIDRRTGDAIAVAEPFQEVAIAATGAAKGSKAGPFRFAG